MALILFMLYCCHLMAELNEFRLASRCTVRLGICLNLYSSGLKSENVQAQKKKKKCSTEMIALVIFGKWNSAPTLNKWGRNKPKVYIKEKAHQVVLLIFISPNVFCMQQTMPLLTSRHKMKIFRASCGLIVRTGGSGAFWNSWDRNLGTGSIDVSC